MISLSTEILLLLKTPIKFLESIEIITETQPAESHKEILGFKTRITARVGNS